MTDTTRPEISRAPEAVSALVRRVIAPNAGPFTYSGTCSYIVGAGDVAIIDPGPDIDAHVETLLAAIRGERLRYILVTHTHRDHSPAAHALKAATAAIVAGCAPHVADPAGSGYDASHDRAYAPDTVLRDGERIELGAATIETVATPGHTANHLCYALLEEQALFTGDHIMGWSTTVVAPPDGNMRDYMASIERLRARGDGILWPGHGDPVREPARYLRALLHHRRTREAAILTRLDEGDTTIAEIVARLYDGVDRRLHGAAAMNVLAHLEDLIDRGLARCEGGATLHAQYARGHKAYGES